MILNTVEAAAAAAGMGNVVVLTSNESSDDVLADTLDRAGVAVFRGVLEDVHKRFCDAARHYKTPWVMRISGDSPLIPAELLSHAAGLIEEKYDLITNVFPRSFPKGHSVEIVKTQSLENLMASELTPEDREHVTRYFYGRPEFFDILNFSNGDDWSHTNYAVDTPEDYESLKTLDKTPAYNTAKFGRQSHWKKEPSQESKSWISA